MGDLSRSLLTGEADPTVQAQNPLELPDGSPTGTPAAQGISDVLLGRNPEGRLQVSMDAAQAKNPDQQARVLALQARTGLPPDLIERNLDQVERQAARADFDARKFRQTSPIVADWLAENPQHAAVAKDDIDNLTDLERFVRGAVGVPRALAGEFVRTPGAVLTGLGELNEAAANTIGRGIRAVGADPVADFLTETQIPWWLNPTEILRRPGAVVKGAGEAIKPPEEDRTVASDIAGGLGQLASQVATAILAPEALVPSLLGMGADIQAERAQEAGATPLEEDAAVVLGAGVTAVLERIGIEKLLERVPPAVKNRIYRQVADISIAGGIEAVQEFGEAVLQNVVTALTYNPQQDLIEGAAQEGGTAFAVGGLGRGILNMIVPGRQAQNARLEAERLQRIAAAAEASKLRERAPELFEQLVRNMAGEDARTVYAPVEAWDTLFQADPEAAAVELLGDAAAYREAKATGGDIAIPVELYASRIAPSEVNAGLLPELRFDPDGMSLREAEEWEANRDEMISAFMAETGQASRPAEDSSGQVYEDVLGQLLGSGVERGAAEKQAVLVQSVFRTLGARTGMDALELYERYGLEVRREMPEALRPFAEIDTGLDPLIDQLRARGGPSDADIFGESLLEMLRARGGLKDEGGELSARDAQLARGRVGERRLVNNETGMDLDTAAEWAVQLGYIPERDTNMLLEAIDEELRGNPVFPLGSEDQQLLGMRQALEQLDEELNRAGIDVAKVSNETIKAFLAGEVDAALVEATMNPESLRTLEQPSVLRRLFQGLVDTIAPPVITGEAFLVDGKPVTANPDTPRGVAIRSLAAPRRFPLDLVLDTFEQADQQAFADQVRAEVEDLRGRVELQQTADTRLFQGDADPDEVRAGVEALQRDLRDSLGLEQLFLSYDPRRNLLKLDNIIVPQDGRKQGTGSAALQAITQFADANGLRMALTPGLQDDRHGTTSRARLVRFYKRFGFVENKGRSKDFTIGEGMIREPQITLDQPAFHGSPHRFDRFSLEAIGTGEGAQAFGWGLYFAGKREIAEFYRKNVSRNYHVDTSNGPMTLFGLADALNASAETQNKALAQAVKNTAMGIAVDVSTGKKTYSEAAAELRESNFSRTYKGIPEALERLTPKPAEGNIYQVDIPDDAELLDWDAPLSEQPEGVREKLKRRVTEVIAVDGLDMGGGSRLRDNRDGQVDPEAPSPWLLETVSANGTSRFGLSQADVDRMLGKKYASDLTGQQIYSRLIAEHGSQRAASQYLHSIGIPGLRYLDAGSRRKGEGTRNYVIWDEAAVTVEAVNDELLQARELKQRGQGRGSNTGKRGMIQFDPARSKFRVTLLQKADLSTFLHESGHFYLEVLGDLVDRGDADPQLQADYQTLLGWMGAADRAGIGTEQHEQFARGFEAYLMEGKAPSPDLQGVFARFRAWLVGVYRALKNLNVELTDEVRGVFDRLVATDEEIAAAEEAQNYQALFEDAEAAGMTDAEFAAYAAAVDAARAEATEDVTRQAMNEITREARSWWADRRAEMRREVEAEVNRQPVYMAMFFLQRGALPDGSPLPDGVRPMKLSKQALVDAYGAPFLKRLPRPYVYTREGGVHPDTVAPLFGFRSGDELVQALVNARARVQVIEAETDERMREQYGDIRTDGTLPEKALAAVHNEKRAQVMVRELRLLHARAKVPGRPTTLQVAKAAAARIIGARRVRDIQPQVYRVAEAKAARAAFDAVAAGDFLAAAEAKRRQLLNHELYRAARDAREAVDKAVTYLRGFDKKPARERIGKAGADYLEQIDALLDRFDLSPISNRALDRRKALAAWVEEQEAAGFQVDVPEDLLNEARRVSWRELSLEQIMGVRDTVKNIEHLARLKNKLLANKKHQDLEAAADDIVGAIEREHGPGGPQPPNFAPGLKDKMGDAFSRFDAAHTKMEFLFRFLDGGEVGATWEALFQPLAAAESAEQVMMREATQRLREIFGAYSRKERALMHLTRIHVPEVGQSFTRASLLAVALNWGNVYNRDVLMRGYGWNEAQVEAILRRLEARDWDVVENIWTFIDGYWPQIEQIQKDLTGLPPEKVEADPFTITVNGSPRELRGGYYPIKYDAGLSFRQQQLEERAQTRELYGNNWLRPATRKGHTKERTDSGGKPVLLDLGVLTQHVTNVVHDLTHRRAILDIDRLIQHPRVAAAIESAAGRAMHRELRPWLQSIANDIREPAGPFERILAHARMGATVVNMGWKITTAIVQPLGYLQSVDVLGERYAWVGLQKFYGKVPYLGQRETVKWVMEQSEMMRNRQRTFDRDVRDALKGMTLSGQAADVQRSFFYLTGLMDMSVAVPTWLGAYQKAMDGAAENVDAGDRLRAIDYADSIVRTTQSAGGAKDLARIQRGSEYHRIFTMFYSYFSVLYNLFKRRFQITRGINDVPRFAASMFYLWFVPAVLSELVAGRGPEDEDEWPAWAARHLISYPFQAVVGLRDLVNAMGPYGYEASPAFDAFEQTVKAAKGIAEAAFTDEEFEAGDAKALALATGYWGVLPARQMWITGSYLYDWMTGAEDPESFAEVLRGLSFSRPPE